jgi:hypothetical protein
MWVTRNRRLRSIDRTPSPRVASLAGERVARRQGWLSDPSRLRPGPTLRPAAPGGAEGSDPGARVGREIAYPVRKLAPRDVRDRDQLEDLPLARA